MPKQIRKVITTVLEETWHSAAESHLLLDGPPTVQDGTVFHPTARRHIPEDAIHVLRLYTVLNSSDTDETGFRVEKADGCNTAAGI
jgi:hypothetical protein